MGKVPATNRRELTTNKSHGRGRGVVGCAWIDLLFPYCADPRHGPTQQYVIIEQDWPLYPEDLEVVFED